MTTLGSILLGFSLATAPTAWASPELPEGLPPEATETLEGLVQDAADAGVPAELVLAKVREGLAKGVPPGLVLDVASGYQGELVEVQQLLGEAPPDVLKASANARGQGAPDQALQTLGDRPAPKASVAILVLGDLTAQGVAPDEALDAVEAALDRGMEPEALLAVGQAAQQLIGQGLPAEDALSMAFDGDLPDIPALGPPGLDVGPGAAGPVSPPVQAPPTGGPLDGPGPAGGPDGSGPSDIPGPPEDTPGGPPDDPRP